MDKTLISADSLSVGYGSKVIVNGIEFYVKKGEILTLIGPNGAGKSTVLKTIAGYLKSLTAQLWLAIGICLNFQKRKWRKAVGGAYRAYQPQLMTCREVVETGRYLYTGASAFIGK